MRGSHEPLTQGLSAGTVTVVPTDQSNPLSARIPAIACVRKQFHVTPEEMLLEEREHLARTKLTSGSFSTGP